MSDSQEIESTAIWRTLLRKRWIKVLLILTGLAGLFIFALPYGIRWGAVYWLQKNGVANATIKDVDFNPFTGELRIFSLGADEATTEKLDSRETVVRLDWLPFAQKHIWIEKIALHDANFNLQRLPDGTLIVGGLKFPPSAPQAVPPPKTDSKPWGFGIDAIDLQNINLVYRQDDLLLTIHINKISTDPIISWEPNRKSSLLIDLTLNGGSIKLDGTVMPFAAEPNGDLQLKVGQLPLQWLLPLLKANEVSALAGEINADLKLSGKQGAQGIRASSDGTFGLQNGSVALPDLQAAIGAVTWSGSIACDTSSDQKNINLHLAGTLNEEGLKLVQGDKPLPTVTLGKAVLKLPELTLAKTTDQTEVTARPDLTLQELTAHDPDQRYQIDQAEMNWAGTIAATLIPEQPPTYSVAGDLSSSTLTVADLNQKLQLAGWKTLKVLGQKIEGPDRIKIDKVDLKQAQFLQEGAKKGRETVRLASLIVDGVGVEPQNTIKIGDITAAGLDVHLLRDPDGKMDVERWVPKTAEKKEETKTVAESKTPPLKLQVGKLSIGNDSRVVFIDQAVKPEYRQTLNDFSLQVGSIDNSKPKQKTPVELSGKLGDYGKLMCKGEVQPFEPKVNLFLEGNLQAFELPPLTPYTARYLGYSLHSGQLDLKWKVPVVNGQINAENHLELAKLDLQTLRPDDEYELTKSLGLPVNTALSLLRDSDDNIILDLPVEGNVDQPEFGTGSIIRKAMINAIGDAIVAYYSPLGIVMGAGKLLSLATALRFDPVDFPPGNAELSGKHKDYLDKMAKLLGDRPKVRLELCPVVAKPDIAYFQEELAKEAAKKAAATGKEEKKDTKTAAAAPPQPPEVPREMLTNLADQRAKEVKDYLIKHGIGAERLFLCNPEINREGDDAPQVKISI